MWHRFNAKVTELLQEGKTLEEAQSAAWAMLMSGQI